MCPSFSNTKKAIIDAAVINDGIIMNHEHLRSYSCIHLSMHHIIMFDLKGNLVFLSKSFNDAIVQQGANGIAGEINAFAAVISAEAAHLQSVKTTNAAGGRKEESHPQLAITISQHTLQNRN